ncbi:MAG: transcription antitermination factor NusB [Spirochaetia bacterium]
MGARRRGRILAFQALYSWECTGNDTKRLAAFSWLDEAQAEKVSAEAYTFARLLFAGTVERKDEIDALIEEHLENWELKRLSRVDLALLRLGCYSLRYQHDVPASVTIDEAVDIAKEFGSEDSYKFINGVLDGVRKSLGR